jgi:hypothetical protein
MGLGGVNGLLDRAAVLEFRTPLTARSLRCQVRQRSDGSFSPCTLCLAGFDASHSHFHSRKHVLLADNINQTGLAAILKHRRVDLG